LLILALIEQRARHGYEIARLIEPRHKLTEDYSGQYG
jgi:DNA-binding PadR family transcriptional regulator